MMTCIVLMSALSVGPLSPGQDQTRPNEESQKASVKDTEGTQELTPKVLLWAEVAVVKDNLATIDVFVDTVTDLRGYQVALEVRAKDGTVYKLADASVNTDREDYVFVGLFSLNAVDLNVPARLMGVLMAGGINVDGVAYLGTFDFEVPKDSSEPFEVVLQGGENTLLRNSNAEPIPFTVATPILAEPVLVPQSQESLGSDGTEVSKVESHVDETTDKPE